jgi:transcriptional regulator with XRE-family HTH domain
MFQPTVLARRFGSVVRRQREQRGWSQEQLAEFSELNRSFVGEIERGQTMPSLVTLSKLAFALDLRLSNLLAHYEGAAAE